MTAKANVCNGSIGDVGLLLSKFKPRHAVVIQLAGPPLSVQNEGGSGERGELQ